MKSSLDLLFGRPNRTTLTSCKPLLLAPLFLLLLSFFSLNNFTPSLFLFPSPSSSSSSSSSSYSKEDSRRECNIYKGEWEKDEEAPYYTNKTCWSVQEHQNCMKYGRPDSEFMRWRWKPEGCDLRRFDPVNFLEMVKGKSLAFVGDSIARNHMQSLMCMLAKVAYPKDISRNKDENFKHMHYSDYNFTISIFWSPFLIKAHLEDTEGPNGTGLWDLYLDEKKLIGCHFCLLNNVTDLTLRYSHRAAFHTAFSTLNKMENFKGQIILRTVSPSHFENGEWNKGGDCVRRKPYLRNEVKFEGLDEEFYRVQMEEFLKAKMEGKKKGIEFKLMDTSEVMLLRPDGHPSRYGHWKHENVTLYNDCVHWCLPGPIDIWNDFMFHILSY
ncbi:PC-Esterase protein [Dioscorea alata]|uniref:PC-Esterase protein n=1 Tax=Dioscorea alata TaxID=55571 RepID=A0ACB7WL64_DIOAL|nr:PC-Esterase protein [Dioscorea alata]